MNRLRPIALTCTLCKLLERMLATHISWWLETYLWYHPAQIGFRQHLGTEDGLEHLSSMVLLGGRPRSIFTLPAMDVHKAYNHVSHSAILTILRWLNIRSRVCNLVRSFLDRRSFSIRIGKERVGHFTSERGLPQGSVLAPELYNVALLPLEWQLGNIPDILFPIYADEITVWSVHADLNRQQASLQAALDKTEHWCATIGLTLSATETTFIR